MGTWRNICWPLHDSSATLCHPLPVGARSCAAEGQFSWLAGASSVWRDCVFFSRCFVMLMEACICHSPERARYDGLGAKQDVGGLYSFMATHSLKWRPMRRRFPVSKPTVRPRALGGP